MCPPPTLATGESASSLCMSLVARYDEDNYAHEMNVHGVNRTVDTRVRCHLLGLCEDFAFFSLERVGPRCSVRVLLRM